MIFLVFLMLSGCSDDKDSNIQQTNIESLKTQKENIVDGKSNFWRLQIKPNNTDALNNPAIDFTKDSFNVDLENISNQDLYIWKEWCSWGYFNLTFQVMTNTGQNFEIHKDQITSWTKNYPDRLVIPSKSKHTFIVNCSEWKGFPAEWISQKVKIKAVYKIEEQDDFWKEFGSVWTGVIFSPEIEVTLIK